jgi:hypothetical protein
MAFSENLIFPIFSRATDRPMAELTTRERTHALTFGFLDTGGQ